LWQNVYPAEVSWFNAVVNAPDGSYRFGGTAVAGNGSRSAWLVDIGYTKGPGYSPACWCLPMLILPALAVGLAARARLQH
jgi:hypothetical protein